MGVAKHGFTIFDSFDNVVQTLASPPNVMPNSNGIYSYNVSVTNLDPNKKYYATPTVSFTPLNLKWSWCEKEKFGTEDSYTLYCRYINWDYDVITLDFSLNSSSGNVINVTKEAVDYNGSLVKANITADYNSNINLLSGTFDWDFYDYSDQRRIDGFTILLENDDSGYVTAAKIIDNGGCISVIRIVRNSSKKSIKSYDGIRISNDNCDKGIMNNYKN